MKRISKQTREQAALICQMAASTNGSEGILGGLRWLTDEYLPLDVQGKHPVYDLASAAFYAARETTESPDGWQNWVEQMAEAEALLRTGWTP